MTILTLSQWSLADATFNMTSYRATAPDSFCESYLRQVELVKETESDIVDLYSFMKEALENGRMDEASEYQHLIDDYTDYLGMHQEDLDRMSFMEVAWFKGDLSEDVTVATVDVSNRMGKWEINNSWETPEGTTAIVAGELQVRVLGGLACTAWENSGLSLKRSIELSFQDLINP